MSLKRRKYANIGLLVIAASLLIYVITYHLAGNRGERSMAGEQAPDFTLADVQGETVRLSDYRGKGVLLNFWGSWCQPCVHEMPRIQEAYAAGVSDVEVLSINVGDSKGTVKEFAAARNLDFRLLIDVTGEVAKSYRVSGLPVTVLVNEHGNIVKRIAGELQSADEITALMRAVQPHIK